MPTQVIKQRRRRRSGWSGQGQTTFQRVVGLVLRLQRQSEDKTIGTGVLRKPAFALHVQPHPQATSGFYLATMEIFLHGLRDKIWEWPGDEAMRFSYIIVHALLSADLEPGADCICTHLI